jgi:hypothetical protein
VERPGGGLGAHRHASSRLSLADAEDLTIPQCVGTVGETLAVIREDREDWLRQQPARAEVS